MHTIFRLRELLTKECKGERYNYTQDLKIHLFFCQCSWAIHYSLPPPVVRLLVIILSTASSVVNVWFSLPFFNTTKQVCTIRLVRLFCNFVDFEQPAEPLYTSNQSLGWIHRCISWCETSLCLCDWQGEQRRWKLYCEKQRIGSKTDSHVDWGCSIWTWWQSEGG